MRVLLIEDDRMVGRGVVGALALQGMSVDWAKSGRSGHDALRHIRKKFDKEIIRNVRGAGWMILKAAS